MPQIFMSLRDENQNIKKVYLNNNYRSRKEITDTVNFIFRQIMSKEAGDVDYDEREYLYPDLPYSPDGNTKIEVGIISAGENEKEKLHNQARYVAHRILESIKNKEQIVEKVNSDGDDILRNIEYSDYCILYRNKKCGKAFGEVFDELGIPYVSDNEYSFMSSPEISFLKALLKTIDNPTDDVSLASVMLSPVYGFTPDELALIRADGRRGRFYRCVVSAAESGNEKAKEFIENTAWIADEMPMRVNAAQIIKSRDGIACTQILHELFAHGGDETAVQFIILPRILVNTVLLHIFAGGFEQIRADKRSFVTFLQRKIQITSKNARLMREDGPSVGGMAAVDGCRARKVIMTVTEFAAQSAKNIREFTNSRHAFGIVCHRLPR